MTFGAGSLSVSRVATAVSRPKAIVAPRPDTIHRAVIGPWQTIWMRSGAMSALGSLADTSLRFVDARFTPKGGRRQTRSAYVL